MYAAHPAFANASPKDPHYKTLAMNKTALFWKAHSRKKAGGESFFSDDFKDLCEQIWKLDPNERITIDGILSHPWMQGETPSQVDIVKEFKIRNLKN